MSSTEATIEVERRESERGCIREVSSSLRFDARQRRAQEAASLRSNQMPQIRVIDAFMELDADQEAFFDRLTPGDLAGDLQGPIHGHRFEAQFDVGPGIDPFLDHQAGALVAQINQAQG